MKHLSKLGMCFISMCLLTMGSLSSHLNAQSGLNDQTFNTPDNIFAQGTNDHVTASAIQGNKLLLAGNFTSYNGTTANRLVRLKNNGKIDLTFSSGTGPNGLITSIIPLSNGKILIAGNFTTYRNAAVSGLVRLFPDGNIDLTFQFQSPGTTAVYLVKLLPDGKLLITANNLFLTRLESNGAIDYSFFSDPGGLAHLQKMAVQSDGKILIAGDKYMGPGNYCALARLNSNGTLDSTFHQFFVTYGDNAQSVGDIAVQPNGNILFGSNVNTDIFYYDSHLIQLNSNGDKIKTINSPWINSILVKNDGKIILTGFKFIDRDITWYALKRSVIRLNTDLSIDSSFVFDDKNIYAHPIDATIQTSLIQPDDKILIGGRFSETGGFITNNVARLNPDGSVDETFNVHKGCNGTVLSSTVLTSGKVIIGGQFTTFNGVNAPNIIRLKKNGQPDTTFHPGTGTNGKIYSISQTGSKILIGGDFTSYNGHPCKNIARLNADGSFDANFTVSADNIVRKIKKDSLNNIFIAGDFKSINSIPSKGIARLFSSGVADTSFHFKFTNYYTPNIYDLTFNSDKLYIAVNYKTYLNQPVRAFVLRLFQNGDIDSTYGTSDEFAEIKAIGIKSNGKQVIGGSILTGDYYTGFVAQLTLNGRLDNSSFQYTKLKSFLNGPVNTIDVLSNDKLIIAGAFSKNASSILDHIGLLNKNGSIDLNFIGTANGTIYTAAKTEDDKLIVGGSFTQYSNVARNSLARIDIGTPLSFTGIQQQYDNVGTSKIEVNLFPNPAKSIINVSSLIPGATLQIYDAMGRMVYANLVQNEQMSIELDAFSNGVYFLVCEGKSGYQTSKFIVNR